MLFKYLTDKDSGKSIAVNPNSVKYIVDGSYGPQLIFLDGINITVQGNFLEVVAQLSAE